MPRKQMIAVVGATGMQGNGLARAILSDPQSGFTVRALTRDVRSDKAKELARLGAEVVAADVHDPESLKRAFAGVYGAFCVFKQRDAFVGKTLGVAGEHLTGVQMAEALARHLGQEVRYNAVPSEVYRTFGFPGADDLGNMFQFKQTSTMFTAACGTWRPPGP